VGKKFDGAHQVIKVEVEVKVKVSHRPKSCHCQHWMSIMGFSAQSIKKYLARNIVNKIIRC